MYMASDDSWESTSAWFDRYLHSVIVFFNHCSADYCYQWWSNIRAHCKVLHVRLSICTTSVFDRNGTERHYYSHVLLTAACSRDLCSAMCKFAKHRRYLCSRLKFCEFLSPKEHLSIVPHEQLAEAFLQEANRLLKDEGGKTSLATSPATCLMHAAVTAIRRENGSLRAVCPSTK